MGLIDVLFRRNRIKNPAKITLKNIHKFVQGTFYKMVIKVPFLKNHLVNRARLEQIDWRREQVILKSLECSLKGECFCGCDLEGLLAADPACLEEGKCFPEMMDVMTWTSFKIENNIKY